MSPTLFYFRNFRFFFFSREENLRHVHIRSPNGEAKFWLEPKVELAVNHGLNIHDLKELERVVEEKEDELRDHWDTHFGC